MEDNFLSQIILEKVSIYDIVRHYRPSFVEGSSLIQCLNPQHSDSTPSMKLYKNSNSAYCFGCGFSGNPISLVSKIEEVSLVEAMKLIKEWFGIKEDLVSLSLKEKSNIKRREQEFAKTWDFFFRTFSKKSQRLDDETLSKLESVYITKDLTSLKRIFEEIKHGTRSLL